MLLENILAYGNYMNGESNRGGAFGFKLDSLNKIGDIKMVDQPNKNLTMYIIEKLEKQHKKSLIDPYDDFVEIDLASKYPLSQLKVDVNELNAGLYY